MLTAGAPARRRRVVIIGGGFAGFHAARALSRLARGLDVEVVLINPTDYSLYLPLLPEVAAGILDPRRVSVPLAATLPGVRLVLGAVEVVDLDARLIVLLDPEGQRHTVGYDQLLLAIGSVNRLLPIPGVAEHAHGFRSVAEAVYLRDHLVRQLELAATSDDPEERAARCTFVVVGAGYTVTEVAAHGQLLTRAAARQRPSLTGQRVRCCWTWRRGSCPNWTAALGPPPAGSCANGGRGPAADDGAGGDRRGGQAVGWGVRAHALAGLVWGCGPTR